MKPLGRTVHSKIGNTATASYHLDFVIPPHNTTHEQLDVLRLSPCNRRFFPSRGSVPVERAYKGPDAKARVRRAVHCVSACTIEGGREPGRESRPGSEAVRSASACRFAVRECVQMTTSRTSITNRTS